MTKPKSGVRVFHHGCGYRITKEEDLQQLISCFEEQTQDIDIENRKLSNQLSLKQLEIEEIGLTIDRNRIERHRLQDRLEIRTEELVKWTNQSTKQQSAKRQPKKKLNKIN